jgi:hypothetical protein
MPTATFFEISHPIDSSSFLKPHFLSLTTADGALLATDVSRWWQRRRYLLLNGVVWKKWKRLVTNLQSVFTSSQSFAFSFKSKQNIVSLLIGGAAPAVALSSPFPGSFPLMEAARRWNLLRRRSAQSDSGTGHPGQKSGLKLAKYVMLAIVTGQTARKSGSKR